MSEAKIRVIQVKSGIGFTQKQRSTLRGLGLRGIRHSATVEDTPAVRGMIAKVVHLVRVEE
ncbi:MAG: 50S ribosomal protein L30 [Deltaproteobacteria bacterium]|nr:50S ribosomal protein L30 [Deltaproteobacteria bacterium]MBW2395590.1 50S ribosomal protein L30 [Deltaproteobacteria bacterium]